MRIQTAIRLLVHDGSNTVMEAITLLALPYLEDEQGAGSFPGAHPQDLIWSALANCSSQSIKMCASEAALKGCYLRSRDYAAG